MSNKKTRIIGVGDLTTTTGDNDQVSSVSKSELTEMSVTTIEITRLPRKDFQTLAALHHRTDDGIHVPRQMKLEVIFTSLDQYIIKDVRTNLKQTILRLRRGKEEFTKGEDYTLKA
ncbi:unnamed protein product [Ilex paraguariensis]|uniref:Uncharacterized protein n=1 Tax=Ilex paraguariensis TaxID=185542 RepID=A0ABC8TIQ5_9AQUA